MDIINKRRSVRRYSDKPVEEAKIEAVFEAVRQSPSWANMQCWRYVLVSEQSIKDKLSEWAYIEELMGPMGYKNNPAQKGIKEAPVVIVLCADPSKSGKMWEQDYYMLDSGIAAQTLMLAAREQGLGTVYVGCYREKEIKELLGIPDDIRVVGMMPIGYALDDAEKQGPSRMEVDEFVFNNRWK